MMVPESGTSWHTLNMLSNTISRSHRLSYAFAESGKRKYGVKTDFVVMHLGIRFLGAALKAVGQWTIEKMARYRLKHWPALLCPRNMRLKLCRAWHPPRKVTLPRKRGFAGGHSSFECWTEKLFLKSGAKRFWQRLSVFPRSSFLSARFGNCSVPETAVVGIDDKEQVTNMDTRKLRNCCCEVFSASPYQRLFWPP